MTNSRLTDPEVLGWRFQFYWKALKSDMEPEVSGKEQVETVQSVAFVFWSR